MAQPRPLHRTVFHRARYATFLIAASLAAALILFACPLDDGPACGEEPPPRQVFIVYLQNQDQLAVAQQVNAEFAPRLEALRQQAEAADRALWPMDKLPSLATRDEEVAYMEQLAQTRAVDVQAQQAHDQAIAALSDLREEIGRETAARSVAAVEASQAEAEQVVKELGGEVLYRYYTLNGLAVLLPPDQAQALSARLGNVPVLADRTMYGDLDVSTVSMGLPVWWDFVNTGGAWDIGIIDSGVEGDHTALYPHGTVRGRFLAGAEATAPEVAEWEPDLPAIGEIRDRAGHGTHVAGIVSSRNNLYKGVAFGHRYIISGKAAFAIGGQDNAQTGMDWSDAMAAADWAINFAEPYRADVVNLSYGELATTDDHPFAQFWDAVVDGRGVFVAVSAGNRNTVGNPPTIGMPGTAYNVVTVANVDDRNTTSIADDVIQPESSWGPTPGGRKKPDLSAPGTKICSCDNSWNGGPEWITWTGTSMATPHVAGAAILMLSRDYLTPMYMKALLINTARDMGPRGWDPAYGWGHVDMAHLNVHFRDTWGDWAAPGRFIFYGGWGHAEDKATLVWHRRAVYNGKKSPALAYNLTNLELYLYNSLTNVLQDASTSEVDNVEQVRWDSDFHGILKVGCSSPYIDGQREELYVLATESGIMRHYGPNPTLKVSRRWNIGNASSQAGDIVAVTGFVSNEGDLPAHDVWLRLSYNKALNLLKGDPIIAVGRLLPGESSPAYAWELEQLTGEQPEASLTAESYSYDETFTDTVELFPKIYLPVVIKESE